MPFCQFGDCEKYTEGGTEFCGTHNLLLRKMDRQAKKDSEKTVKTIAKVSTKRRSQIVDYSKQKAIFITGKVCPIYPKEPVTEIHHVCGRTGFIDDWARDHGIPALLDERYWLAVSTRGHQRIELNPQWAKDKGYSVSRLTKK